MSRAQDPARETRGKQHPDLGADGLQSAGNLLCYHPSSEPTGRQAASTRAAQNLNSGILPTGSSAELVRVFAAASA